MTTNHTELCERLSADAGDVGKNYSSPIGHRIDDAVMLIEQQAARIQQQADRIAELEQERDALKADAERYVWSVSSTDNAESLWAAVMSCGPSARESINIEIAAALQAEKETRS